MKKITGLARTATITTTIILFGCMGAGLRAQAPAPQPAPAPTEKYPVDSASVEHAGIPKGEVLHFTFDHSAIFPGTWREYWVYIPAQYRADQPACVYVNQDGIQWKAPTVFDNLIAAKEMPVTIGVFITPGRVRTADAGQALDRFNRSLEYDGLGDGYVKFLMDELLPDVEKHTATDGRAIHLSRLGSDRAIGGSSSGAIAAFTAAWERPDAFSRVFSAIGTYVPLRGGDRYPGLIRKYEPKPLRIFLQDGSNDLNIYGGDWWKANETMERALVFAGYEVQHEWGTGGHNGQMGTSLFPDAMRWLWKDWPKPVAAGSSKNQMLSDLLIPGENWELVGENYGFTEGTAANAAGDVFFQDIPNAKTYVVGPDGKPVVLPIDSKKASGTAFGPDGKRYVVAGTKLLVYGAGKTADKMDGTGTMGTVEKAGNVGKKGTTDKTSGMVMTGTAGKKGTTDKTSGMVMTGTADNNSDVGKMGDATVLADSVSGNDVCVARNGNIYLTSPDGVDKPGKLYLVRPNGEKKIVDVGLKFPNGLTLTPDQTQLYATESASHWIWLYTILPDGTLTNRQRYGWLHVPDTQENAWPDGLRCDTAGRVFCASKIGMQVLDQAGRVNCIIPVPPANGQSSNVVFGGPAFNILYVTSGNKVFRRKLKTRGVNLFDVPVRPVTPRL